MKKIKYHGLGKKEADIYSHAGSSNKISDSEVVSHWNVRGKRKGIQSIFSVRFTLKENKKFSDLEIAETFKFLKGEIKLTDNVFELGTGIGRMTNELSKRVKSVTTNDISRVMLARSKNKLKKRKNIVFKYGKIFDLKLKPKSFNLVFESRILIHILNKKEIVRTVREIKKLSDTIFISEFMINNLRKDTDTNISKFSILRTKDDYIKLFKPFKLVKTKKFDFGDPYTMMLFKRQ